MRLFNTAFAATPAFWAGFQGPNFSYASAMGDSDLGEHLLDLSFRIGLRPSFQLRTHLGYDLGLDLTDLVLTDSGDVLFSVLENLRVGGERGPWLSAGGGILYYRDNGRPSLKPGIEFSFGWLFGAQEHFRHGPELNLGSVNTLSYRLEWGWAGTYPPPRPKPPTGMPPLP